jgi:hypothetical protein
MKDLEVGISVAQHQERDAHEVNGLGETRTWQLRREADRCPGITEYLVAL